MSRTQCSRPKAIAQSGTLVHACNPSLLEVKAEGTKILGQPELHSKTMSVKGAGGSEKL